MNECTEKINNHSIWKCSFSLSYYPNKEMIQSDILIFATKQKPKKEKINKPTLPVAMLLDNAAVSS